jgi:uncharacterized membrane protein YdjX (TVP38/TMEM64 family)
MADTDTQTRQRAAARPSAGIPLARLALAAAALAALVALGRVGGEQLGTFRGWVEGLGAWGPAAFVAGYAGAVVAFAPASVLTLAAGAIFGIAEGTVYVFAAALLGSSLAFLISRYVARGAIERRLEGNARFQAVDVAVGQQGRRIVFLLRLSPVFPFNLLNYALGLTRVRFVDYLIAGTGMLPGTLAYVYLGSVAGEVASLAGGAGRERSPIEYALFGVGLLATFAVAILVARIARRALGEATGAEVEAT